MQHIPVPQGERMSRMAQPIAVSKPIRRAVAIDEGLGGFSTQQMYREILSRLGEDPTRDA